MSTKGHPAAGEACEKMIREHFPEGLVRTLERRYPGASQDDYEDAVATGFEKLIATGRDIENPRGYVTTVSVHKTLRILKLAAVEQLAAASDYEDRDGEELAERATDVWSNPPLDEALAKHAFDAMRSIIERWESKNVKTATLLVVDAGLLEEPLSSAELAERLAELLGQDVLPETARQWRKRGLDRLRNELVAVELLDETEKA
jgi:hypothetical protein